MLTVTKTAVDAAGEGCRLEVAGEMTIARIGELKDALCEALDNARQVEVCLAQVTDIDLTGLQLLCAAHASATARGRRLALAAAPSGIVTKAMTEAGFARHVGCPRGDSATCCLVTTSAVRSGLLVIDSAEAEPTAERKN